MGENRTPRRVLCIGEAGSALSSRVNLGRGDIEVRLSDDPEGLDDVDCVVLVHDPPTADGIETLEAIRERDGAVPVVFVDREASPGVASEVVALDVTEYVPGDDPGEVAERIESAIETRQRGIETGGDHFVPFDGYERASDLLDAVLEQIPVHLYVKDEAGRHVLASSGIAGDEEVLGKTDRDLYGDELDSASYEDDMRVIEEGEQLLNETERNPEQNQFFLTSKVPFRGAEGDIRGLIGVTRNASERLRHRRQLERQNERLEKVASVISHDVRNPLNLAIGRVALAAQECDSEHLSEVQWSLDRMSELLEDLLTMVRQGQWVEETELVSMQTVATDAWEGIGADPAHLEFDQEFFFEADRPRCRQLLENLFTNARRHGGEDVSVRIGPLSDWSGFYVEDDGPGIPEDEREQVFDSGFTTTDEGSGFGLVIVETIAEAHGWDVRVTEGSRGGARFEFVGVGFE